MEAATHERLIRPACDGTLGFRERRVVKLQVQDGSLRLRLDEAELATLLGGGIVGLRACLDGRPLLDVSVRLGDMNALDLGTVWSIALRRDDVHAYVGTLPRRDALRLPLGSGEGALALDFEVDVRDSLQLRGARRRER